MASDNGHLTDLLKAAGGDIMPAPVSEQPVELVYGETFECPECNNQIPADAVKCPSCGVEFEMEEVFECPMCKSLIDVNVSKCPSCGAEFEEEGAEVLVEAAPQPVVESEPEPEPTQQAPTEPVSFTERMKAMKDQPHPKPVVEPQQPKKELSFAERMKAMKEGKMPDKEPEPAPAPAKTPPPATKPAPTTSTQQAPAQASELSIAERMQALKQGVGIAPKTEETPAPPQSPKPHVSQPTAAPMDEEAKKEAYKELPRYIGEVKKLLLLANDLSLDVSTSKALINKAVTAGKNRDLDNAIKLVKEGKAGLEREIKATMSTKLRTLSNAVSIEKKSGRDVSDLEAALDDIKKSLDAGEFQIASDEMKDLEAQMSTGASASLPQAELQTIEKTILDAASLHVNVEEAKSFLNEAKMAVDLDDSEKASQMARQASDSLNRVLPGYIAGEMRKAKVTLREVKMMNVDITKPVDILKEANNYVRDGDYFNALGSIKEFKDFVNKVKG